MLLATFMAALVQTKERLHLLRAPLIVFAIGACLAALAYVPLVAVSGQATNFIYSHVTEFFLNERDTKDMTGYGFNCAGRIVVFALMICSLICFGVGVFLCISVLGKLSWVNAPAHPLCRFISKPRPVLS